MPYRKLPAWVNYFSEIIASKTSGLVATKYGYHCLRVAVMLSPIFFVPTIWEAWTAENIDVFRTVTWPSMISSNVANFILLCQGNHDWCVRLCAMAWLTITLFMVLAIVVR
jgi:hypothetical protein